MNPNPNPGLDDAGPLGFERLAFYAGLPPIRLHDLRHGAATLALAAGADMKLVSAMLRHSSIGITADTYASVLPEVAREAAEASAALVPRMVAVGGCPELSVSLRSPKPNLRSGGDHGSEACH